MVLSSRFRKRKETNEIRHVWESRCVAELVNDGHCTEEGTYKGDRGF